MLQRFPHVEDVQWRYRGDGATLVVKGRCRAADTVGTAFDWLVRFLA